MASVSSRSSTARAASPARWTVDATMGPPSKIACTFAACSRAGPAVSHTCLWTCALRLSEQDRDLPGLPLGALHSTAHATLDHAALSAHATLAHAALSAHAPRARPARPAGAPGTPPRRRRPARRGPAAPPGRAPPWRLTRDPPGPGRAASNAASTSAGSSLLRRAAPKVPTPAAACHCQHRSP